MKKYLKVSALLFFCICFILYLITYTGLGKGLSPTRGFIQQNVFTILISVLVISVLVGWGISKRSDEKKELRQAQLKALKKGKVNVNIKGKMNKLK
jgi:sensor domain CHASE-containing protein